MAKIEWESELETPIFGKEKKIHWEKPVASEEESPAEYNARVFNFSDGYAVGEAPPEWSIDGDAEITWLVQATGPNATYPKALHIAKSGNPITFRRSKCLYTEPEGAYLTSLTQAESIWLVRMKASFVQNLGVGTGTRAATTHWYGLGFQFSSTWGSEDVDLSGCRTDWNSDTPTRLDYDDLASSLPTVYTLDDTTWWMIRHRVNTDNTVMYKLWKYGESEPTEWTKSYSTSLMTVAQGRDNSKVFMVADGNTFMDIAYVSIGWGDNLPQPPS